jgi:hypothetical protein
MGEVKRKRRWANNSGIISATATAAAAPPGPLPLACRHCHCHVTTSNKPKQVRSSANHYRWAQSTLLVVNMSWWGGMRAGGPGWGGREPRVYSQPCPPLSNCLSKHTAHATFVRLQDGRKSINPLHCGGNIGLFLP